MEREVSRDRKLPPFSLDLASLEALWNKVTGLFADPGNVRTRLEITLGKEKLTFSSMAETRAYKDLPQQVTNFSLTATSEERHISLNSSSLFSGKPVVRASASTEAWCAGAVETVQSFLVSNKLWYWWFANTPFGMLLIFCIYTPTLALLFLPKGIHLNIFILIAWLVVTICFAILLVFNRKLFPAAILLVRQQDGFVRRHAAELTLLVACLSLVLTVVGWFFAK